MDGGLKVQNADTQTNASHAGITVNYTGTGSAAGEAYSNHEYRESGYQTLTHEHGPLNWISEVKPYVGNKPNVWLYSFKKLIKGLI